MIFHIVITGYVNIVLQDKTAGLGGQVGRGLTGDQEVARWIPAKLIMKYILRSFSPFLWMTKSVSVE